MSLASYRDRARRPACAFWQEKQEYLRTGIVIYCISLLPISMGACLPEREGKISKGFYPKPATPVAFPFPFPSQKGGAVIQNDSQMTVELHHPVI